MIIINNYYRFASGEDFKKVHDKILLLDVPMKPTKSLVVERDAWKRSGILRTQAIEYAEFACEKDRNHKSFIAESTHKPYMEGHHAIPIRLQPNFNSCLDVYANIVCLCPLCHRQQQSEKSRVVSSWFRVCWNREITKRFA